MDTASAVLIVGALLVLTVAVGLFWRRRPSSTAVSAEVTAAPGADELKAAEAAAAQVKASAAEEADGILARARAEAEQLEQHADDTNARLQQKRLDLEQREARLGQREARLHIENRALEGREYEVSRQEAAIAEKFVELEELENARHAELARVAGLTAEQAKQELIDAIESQAKREAAIKARDIERAANEDAQTRAREIITLAIQRLASEQTSEAVVSVLNLPGDEMKGRIIGREGRNIRAFEQITGVNVIIDDTPEAVLLSCFDPVRREIARLTLEELVLDGRIHPHRIEEQYSRCKAEVENLCIRAGEDALVEVGVADVHPDLVALLGRLKYRTSYGQNVLQHLLESAHLAGMMAAELGLDVTLAKRCALLHDIGKALTHEVEGSHALIGAEVARRYGESEDVVHAIEAHHNEVEVRTVEAVLTQAADAISGSRPGARRESLEAYVKRLERLEEIAMAQEGVEKVFAMQAGREIRVMVLPDAVDDLQAQVLARDIAKQVEEELTYPGQIRITVVRESRATEFAR
ncbi:ribonuclease Y [Phytoactinopolyspora alkaliphila]|uniref:Ribonuclease Y n=1 Tax=Phytoactinopolyspora alkaliphila TaxID=1783498 RepID=A0A6N9YFW2_9ACTN|nr:ribonuclease Y [Phytoactinopolyspora alkaliphila]NED93779.1 ribonuclease Y [Phytoactinopolyspora alkaliphila]